jgi:hypothetical protein
VSGQLHARFTTRRSHRYPLDRLFGGPQSRSGQRGEQKILDPTGTRNQTHGSPARSQSLYRTLFPCVTSKLNRFPETQYEPYNSVRVCRAKLKLSKCQWQHQHGYRAQLEQLNMAPRIRTPQCNIRTF